MDKENIPTVSVVVSTYNRKDFLPRAVKSILSQTYEDFELIVVDDGSPEPVQPLLDSFNDNRIKCIRKESSEGLPAGRNTGIKAAKGEYIAFLDDDDEWFDSRLEKTVEAMKRASDKTGVVYCKFIVRIEETGKEIYNSSFSGEGYIYQDALEHLIAGSPCLLVKRICFYECGMFDESFELAEDWDMQIRLAEKYEFVCLDKPLAYYSLHEGQMSEDISGQLPGTEHVLDKYFEKISLYPRILSNYYRILALYALASGDKNRAVNYVFKSFRTWPLSLFQKSNWGVLIKGFLRKNRR